MLLGTLEKKKSVDLFASLSYLARSESQGVLVSAQVSVYFFPE